MSPLTSQPGTDLRDRVRDYGPTADALNADLDECAAAVGATPEELRPILRDPAFQMELERRSLLAQATGKHLRPKAARLAGKLLDRLTAAVDADELDVGEIADALPKVHRVIEHADKMDEAGRTSNGYATVVVNIGTGGRIQVTPVEPADVIDAEVKETGAEL